MYVWIDSIALNKRRCKTASIYSDAMSSQFLFALTRCFLCKFRTSPICIYLLDLYRRLAEISAVLGAQSKGSPRIASVPP